MNGTIEATRCVICGSDEARGYAPGPHGVGLCGECAARSPEDEAVRPGSRCSFCRSGFSRKPGSVLRRDRRVGLVGERGAVCRSCLGFARQLLSEG